MMIPLLIAVLSGVLAGVAYQGLQKIASSERVARVVFRWQTAWHMPHVLLEFVLILFALPFVIAPFAFLLSMPRWLRAAGIAADPIALVAAPIIGLLALGVTMRTLRKRNRAKQTA
jgi:hypothetical protein